MSGVTIKGGLFSENRQVVLEDDLTYIPEIQRGTRLRGWINSFTEGSVTLLPSSNEGRIMLRSEENIFNEPVI
jgi:hypothetical protein